jgi:TP901 family phage tail tape measure protein
MAYLSHAGQSADVTQQEKLDFIVSMSNLTWPAVAAISGGFQTLTGVGMRTSQQLNANFTQAQAGIMAAGGIASLALFDMTQKAMRFNREMALVKGLIGDISSREMAQLSNMAKKVAVDFGEMPSEVAKGLQVVARAGIGNTAEQMKVLVNGMRLAKVEGMDVEEAMTGVITATALFGDSYQNVERYASAIAHAANVSVASAKDISLALKYVGGAAKEHWSVEETLAGIATMSQKGVQG